MKKVAMSALMVGALGLRGHDVSRRSPLARWLGRLAGDRGSPAAWLQAP
nr:hypothetical protein [Sphingomonas sp.]